MLPYIGGALIGIPIGGRPKEDMGGPPIWGGALIGMPGFGPGIGPPRLCVGSGIRSPLIASEYLMRFGYELSLTSCAADQTMKMKYARSTRMSSIQKKTKVSVKPQTKAVPIRCTSRFTIVEQMEPEKRKEVHQKRYPRKLTTM